MLGLKLNHVSKRGPRCLLHRPIWSDIYEILVWTSLTYDKMMYWLSIGFGIVWTWWQFEWSNSNGQIMVWRHTYLDKLQRTHEKLTLLVLNVVTRHETSWLQKCNCIPWYTLKVIFFKSNPFSPKTGIFLEKCANTMAADDPASLSPDHKQLGFEKSTINTFLSSVRKWKFIYFRTDSRFVPSQWET